MKNLRTALDKGAFKNKNHAKPKLQYSANFFWLESDIKC